MTQVRLSKPQPVALIIDEELLDDLASFVSGELIFYEDNAADDELGDELPPEDQMKYRFYHMERHSRIRRLAALIDSLDLKATILSGAWK